MKLQFFSAFGWYRHLMNIKEEKATKACNILISRQSKDYLTDKEKEQLKNALNFYYNCTTRLTSDFNRFWRQIKDDKNWDESLLKKLRESNLPKKSLLNKLSNAFKDKNKSPKSPHVSHAFKDKNKSPKIPLDVSPDVFKWLNWLDNGGWKNKDGDLIYCAEQLALLKEQTPEKHQLSTDNVKSLLERTSEVKDGEIVKIS